MMKRLIALIAFAVACNISCGDDENVPELGSCPSGDSTATQQAGLSVFQTQCLRCHSVSVTGAARGGAPTDQNFDTVSSSDIDPIWQQIATGDMPPDGTLGSTDVENLRVWLACGTNPNP